MQPFQVFYAPFCSFREMGVCVSCRRTRDVLIREERREVVVGINKMFVGQPVWEGGEGGGREALEARRKEFWDTAPEFGGRREVWTALKSATEFSERGDYAMAQAIVDGAGITLPTGYLSESYDELGHHYIVPNYCLARPKRNSKDCSLSPSRSLSQRTQEDVEMRVTYGTDKPPDTKIRIRINGGKDIKLEVSSEDTVLECKARVCQLHHVSTQSQVWCYSGRILKNSDVIRGVNYTRGYVIQVCQIK